MNPLTWFMQLKPVVKMTIIICLTLLLLFFMHCATESGSFNDIVKYLTKDSN